MSEKKSHGGISLCTCVLVAGLSLALIGMGLEILAQSMLGLTMAMLGALLTSGGYIYSFATGNLAAGGRNPMKTGQTALLVFVIMMAVIAAVFWNWSSVESMDWNIISLPENPSLQIIFILAVMIIILFAYMAYKVREPKVMRSG